MGAQVTDTSMTASGTEAGWYYTSAGQRIGPVSGADLRQLLSENKINGDTPLWKPELGAQWKALRETDLGVLVAGGPPPVAGNQIGNSLVWAVAVLPLVSGFIRSMLIEASLESGSETTAQWPTVVGVFALILNVALNLLDERKLEEAGHGGKWLTAFALILTPVYLFMRASRLKQIPSYAIVWLITFFISLYV